MLMGIGVFCIIGGFLSENDIAIIGGIIMCIVGNAF